MANFCNNNFLKIEDVKVEMGKAYMPPILKKHIVETSKKITNLAFKGGSEGLTNVEIDLLITSTKYLVELGEEVLSEKIKIIHNK